MASLRLIKGQRMSFIIIWKVAGELHSPKNMTSGLKSPRFVEKAPFHSSPSFSQTLLKPQWVQGGEPFCIVQPGEHVGDQWKWVGVLHCDLIQLLVVLH